MLKRLATALSLFTFSLYAITLSVNIGREQSQRYSVIHIRAIAPFKCFSEIDEFDNLKQVQCRFEREPKEKFKPMATTFFKIDSFIKNKKYYIRVYPVHKMALFPIAYTLYNKESIYQADKKTPSKHWIIVGFSKKLPLIKVEKTPPMGLNFPIEMSELLTPSVGALDISGNPIVMDKFKDVNGYMRIKKDYEEGNYNLLAQEVDELFKLYPKTIFKAELLLYKIRGYHHTNDSEALLRVAKEFIWNYSDDENLPEVLAYTANAYSTVGMQTDAKYFYDRLFNEFPKSKFSSLGMIFLGDQFIAEGKEKDAEHYFKKALYKTKDVEIASMAAIRLAKLSMDKGDYNKTAAFYEKIIEGNPQYLLHDIVKNYDVATGFANREKYKTAIDILQAMLNLLPQDSDRYEMILKDLGLYLSKTKDKARAYKILTKYQKLYPDGEYASEIQKALDSLFYTPKDANKTALLAEYEYLQQKYVNQEIGQKAALEKAKLFYAQKRYEKVLEMNASEAVKESGFKKIVYDSALMLTRQALKQQQCDKASRLSKEYNLTLARKYDGSLYRCVFELGEYKLAKEIAQKHLKDKTDRLKWIYKYAKTAYKLREYKDTIDAAKDVVALCDLEKNTKYYDILQEMFYSYERLGDTEGMVKTIKMIQNRRGLIYEDIELYVQMVKLGLKKKDNTIILTYADKVMKLQDKAKSYTQSPFVEFAAIQALEEQNKIKQEEKLLYKIIKQGLKGKNGARARYMLGSLLLKENKLDEAKKLFKESIKADDSSAWADLSKDALQLMDEK